METKVDSTFSLSEEQISFMTLFGLFLRIAFSSFGGYMAMISSTQNMIVVRRKLMSDHDVLDGISLASVLPGPIAINVVAYVGYRLRGNLGALVCVCAAITPAFLLMMALSIAYFHWGHIPAIGNIFLGVVPAVVAIILVAAWNMWRKSITSLREGVLALAAVAALLGIGGLAITLATIAGAALAGWWWFYKSTSQFVATTARIEPTLTDAPTPFAGNDSLVSTNPDVPIYRLESTVLLLASVPGVASVTLFGPAMLFKLFCTFSGLSLLLFGGAYVFIPILQQTVVSGYGWVTQREFADAVAMSQMMPGPVIVSAAFVGFKVAGLAGALVATLGIVMPSVVVMLLCTRMLDGIKDSKATMAALRGVRAAVIGMVIAAAVLIGKTAAPGWLSLVICAAAFLALVRYRVEAVWVVPIAGLIGFLMY